MRFINLIPALALGFVLVGCDGSESPTAPAVEPSGLSTPVMDAARLRSGENSFDFDFVEDRCSAEDGHEDVYVEGTFAVQWHRAWTSSDQWAYVSNYEIRGEGYGLSTGAAYALRGQGTFTQIIGPVSSNENPWIETEVSTLNLIGQGGAPNLREKYHFDYTVNANGDLVILEESLGVTCQ